MARHGTLNNAIFRLTILGLLALLFAAPVLAQDEAAEEPGEDKFAKIQATSDSLGFGSTAADSLQEVPRDHRARRRPDGRRRPLAPGQDRRRASCSSRAAPSCGGCSLVALVGFIFIIERLWTLNRARVNTRRLIGTVITTLRNDGVQAAAEECQKVRGPIAAILYSGLQKADKGRDAVEKAIATAGTIEMSFLERGLIWVSSVTTIAPLMGFLGTVSGMINAFEAIAASEQVNAKLVASGISEALITTATGLIVAIPATIGYNYFVSAIDRFVIEMEETSAELIEELERMKG